MKNVILTGDRPTGRLHIGHYVGSLSNRVKLQNEGNYDEMFIMIADAQALTDNFDNPKKVRENVIEVALDYLAVGLDPEKVNIFIQSEVPGLTELTYYYTNLVTLSRLQRNPTVKSELKQRDFETSIPVGFLNYPISQAADITGFNATIVPVGDDQLPMIEQAVEIVRSFNRIYGETLVEPKAVLPDSKTACRLPGTDGKAKMSKSLGNCIYLSDTEEEIKKKVMGMYTDPNHIKVDDPGQVEGNMVFTYLEVFAKDDDFDKYLPEYKNLDELKAKYRAGGLGDVVIKKFLNSIIQERLKPIREKRTELEGNLDYVYEVLQKGTKRANEVVNATVKKVKAAIKIDYFENEQFLKEIKEKYNK
jgi:tryptophanyl-tRNA synthetase